MILALLGVGTLVSLLIWVVVFCVVLYVVYLVLNMITLPAPVKQIILVVVGLIALLLLLQHVIPLLAL